ncbi:MAG TPA: alpha/beta hydrolase family protein [Actinoplanes sp.]|jgi:pimeloyl-ACP methyl ester carboxylesterase
MHLQPPRRTTRITTNPNSLIVYDQWGGFGRPVLLLHGLLFDRTMWWPVAAELATASCTVIAPDLPGHGQSPLRDDYRLERIAGDLAVLVDRLGLRRAPILVGHAASVRLADVFADAYATHHVFTIDEPPADAGRVEDLVVTAGLRDVPEIFRSYAERRTDPVLLNAYESWLARPATRSNRPAMAGRPSSRSPMPHEPFLHLTDPQRVAAELRHLL